jgi:hypothetical protein
MHFNVALMSALVVFSLLPNCRHTQISSEQKSHQESSQAEYFGKIKYNLGIIECVGSVEDTKIAGEWLVTMRDTIGTRPSSCRHFVRLSLPVAQVVDSDENSREFKVKAITEGTLPDILAEGYVSMNPHCVESAKATDKGFEVTWKKDATRQCKEAFQYMGEDVITQTENGILIDYFLPYFDCQSEDKKISATGGHDMGRKHLASYFDYLNRIEVTRDGKTSHLDHCNNPRDPFGEKISCAANSAFTSSTLTIDPGAGNRVFKGEFVDESGVPTQLTCKRRKMGR